MTYIVAVLLVSLCSAAAGLASYGVHRRISGSVRRHHHEVGGAVFLQLGVIYAVLLAFVFSETLGEYNIAAQAINEECGDLHGSTMLANELPGHVGDAYASAARLYVTAVITKEWPLMARHRASPDARHAMHEMIHLAAEMPTSQPRDERTRDQIVGLLMSAHTQRETRLFQMNQGLPVVLWLLLIAYAGVLTSFVVLSGVDYAATLVIFSSLFCGLTLLILVIIRMLDYPFEGALALQPTDFQATLARMQTES